MKQPQPEAWVVETGSMTHLYFDKRRAFEAADEIRAEGGNAETWPLVQLPPGSVVVPASVPRELRRLRAVVREFGIRLPKGKR